MTPEPVPPAYHIIPHYSPVTGILTSFTVEDPEGSSMAKWQQYVDDIHREYQGIPEKEIRDAAVGYTQYRAIFTLGRSTFTFESLKGKPAAQDLSTPQRLAKYGVREEDFQKVIELDGKFTLEELRTLARDHGLPVSGDKKKIIARLMEEGLL